VSWLFLLAAFGRRVATKTWFETKNDPGYGSSEDSEVIQTLSSLMLEPRRGDIFVGIGSLRTPELHRSGIVDWIASSMPLLAELKAAGEVRVAIKMSPLRG
jgi:hypothetical protein